MTIFDSKEKACIFNEYFVLQSELPVVNAIPPAIQPYQTQRFLSHIIATEEQVLELMKGVDISEACGYHGVGNKIIKLCSEGFHFFLLILLICPSHSVSTRANGSLQMLFLYLKMTTVSLK